LRRGNKRFEASGLDRESELIIKRRSEFERNLYRAHPGKKVHRRAGKQGDPIGSRSNVGERVL